MERDRQDRPLHLVPEIPLNTEESFIQHLRMLFSRAPDQPTAVVDGTTWDSLTPSEKTFVHNFSTINYPETPRMVRLNTVSPVNARAGSHGVINPTPHRRHPLG
jgi:hypothetical protein